MSVIIYNSDTLEPEKVEPADLQSYLDNGWQLKQATNKKPVEKPTEEPEEQIIDISTLTTPEKRHYAKELGMKGAGRAKVSDLEEFLRNASS
jgi:hypothetical protein